MIISTLSRATTHTTHTRLDDHQCTPPPPVAAAFARDEGAVRGLRVFFAANLKDNGPLIRHFTTRLLEVHGGWGEEGMVEYMGEAARCQ